MALAMFCLAGILCLVSMFWFQERKYVKGAIFLGLAALSVTIMVLVQR